MKFIAQELREYMAKLGVKSLNEMCGRTDLLKLKAKQGFKRAALVDMSRILANANAGEKLDESHFVRANVYNFELEKTVDEKFLLPAFEKQKKAKKGSFEVKVTSTDRTCGTILGSEIQKAFGNSLEEDCFVVNAMGGGGQ